MHARTNALWKTKGGSNAHAHTQTHAPWKQTGGSSLVGSEPLNDLQEVRELREDQDFVGRVVPHLTGLRQNLVAFCSPAKSD